MATTKTRRTPDEIVRALLTKTMENGATAGEEQAAVAKATQIIAKHRLDRSQFDFPPSREVAARTGQQYLDGLRGDGRD